MSIEILNLIGILLKYMKDDLCNRFTQAIIGKIISDYELQNEPNVKKRIIDGRTL